MTRPYKTTGCFRFFLFIIILAPLAYLGASYYNGQDGIQNIKNLFTKGTSLFSRSTSKEVKNQPVQEQAPVNTSIPSEVEAEYKAMLELKDKQIDALIKENLDLKQQLQQYENKEPKKSPQ